jgi:hypothetical protein
MTNKQTQTTMTNTQTQTIPPGKNLGKASLLLLGVMASRLFGAISAFVAPQLLVGVVRRGGRGATTSTTLSLPYQLCAECDIDMI